MRVLILRSRKTGACAPTQDPYRQQFNTPYGERVIGNLRGEPGFCTSCGPDCTFCRKSYGRCFGGDLCGIIDFPALLPHVLEKPEPYVPSAVPAHDVLLVIHIHEQVLLEILKACAKWGTRGVVVPLEHGDWLLGATKAEAQAICERHGIEIAFPKPFCDFDPPKGSVLAGFREHFHIGRPEVDIEVKGEKIVRVHVAVSAACGATYYIARWLSGRRTDENLEIDVISKRLHTYPCTAGMEWDDEIGDTCLHVAGQAHYRLLSSIRDVSTVEAGLVRSPVGRMVQKAVPAYENLARIEEAKQSVLARLAESGGMALGDLRKSVSATPAALNSALLILKSEGRIRTEQGRIVLVDEFPPMPLP